MQPLSPWRLIWKRNASDWKLVISIALGVLIATTVVAGTPIYLNSLEKLGVKKAVESHSDIFLDITVYEPYIVLDRSKVDKANQVVSDASDSHISGLVFQREQLLKGPLLLSAMPGEEIPSLPSPFPPSRGYLQHMTNIEDHVTIVSGRFPTSEIFQAEEGPLVEVVLGGTTADFFSLKPGDIVTLAPSSDSPKVFARITGFVVANDPHEQYWQGNASIILSPPPVQQSGEVPDAEDEEQPPLALLVSKDVLIESLSQTYPGTVVSSFWFLLVDGEVVKNSPTSQTSKRLGAFESELKRHMPEAGVFTGIRLLIRDFNNRLFFSRVPFYLLMALMLAVVLYYLTMMAAYMSKRHEQEAALSRSRGVGLLQLLRLYTLEGLLLIGFAVVVSPLLAVVVVALMGKTPFLTQLTGGDLLSVSLGLTPFLASLSAGLLCLIILITPRMFGARSGMVTHKLRSSRPPSIPWFQRYFIDVGLVVIGGLIFWELESRGSLVSGGLFHAPSINETLLLAPILFLISVTLIFMRFFPIIVRVLSKLFADRTPVWLTLSLWHMARNPLQYTWLVLLLVLVTGLGILATTLGGTLKLSYEERVLYDTGTDIRIDRLPSNIRIGRVQLKEVLQTLPGATSVSIAFRGPGRFGVTRLGTPFTMLAMESQQFSYISWYRPDFSDSSLASLMRTLGSVERFESLELPPNTNKVGMWVKPGSEYPNVFLWLVFKDANDTTHTISLGSLGKPDWHYLEEEIPSYAISPLTLEAIQIYEPVYGPTGTPGYFRIDNLQIATSQGEGPQTLESFENIDNWTPLATSALSSDELFLTNADVKDGLSAVTFRWGKGTNRGIRGIYRSPSGGPLPIVASKSFLASTGRNVGDTLVLTIFERFVPVVIRDMVDYFPTLDPEGTGFVLADLDLLLNHLNLLGPLSTISPNELFISTIEGSHEVVVNVAQSLVRAETQIHDQKSQLNVIREDPLITGGWKVLVFFSIGIILFTATLGYITYLLSSAASSRGEMGYLQAIGLSRRQIMGIVTIEHLVMAVVGVAIGTWAGIQMAKLSVSSVSQTEAGRPILPPFILVTEWGIMAIIYAILAAIVLVSLYTLSRSIVRLDLNVISKMEE